MPIAMRFQAPKILRGFFFAFGSSVRLRTMAMAEFDPNKKTPADAGVYLC
jgi:hypothetical protein